jgi:hypothetical protein
MKVIIVLLSTIAFLVAFMELFVKILFVRL